MAADGDVAGWPMSSNNLSDTQRLVDHRLKRYGDPDNTVVVVWKNGNEGLGAEFQHVRVDDVRLKTTRPKEGCYIRDAKVLTRQVQRIARVLERRRDE